ncbi:TcpQ domain-containing protein [Glaciecola sp. 2405UD65-10]|jgi:hypothetical protein|uniref:TcpQ domain-containing protein n=1 Tax=Glaciecola sp. 2405UD65-10 TaxID=3397244 RepID=UPI003B5CD563
MAVDNLRNFWLKRIAGIIAVILVTIAFLVFVPNPTETDTSIPADENSVAANVSRFYEEFKQVSRDPIKERYGDFVVLLDNQERDLADAINNVSEQNHPPMDDWSGEYKERPFTKDSTLMQEAKAFVAKEGMKLIWDLNQDFIIRERFVSSNTLVGMLEDIAGAVDSNFEQPILIYFCFKKRALVITDEATEYLDENCEKSAGSLYQNY